MTVIRHIESKEKDNRVINRMKVNMFSIWGGLIFIICAPFP